MAVSKIYKYGIKYPFTKNNEDGLAVDMNDSLEGQVASEIAHVILTPKKTRIRMPEFGTNLIKFIFDMNDDAEWDDVKEEIKTQVAKYVSNVNIEDIQIEMPEGEDNGIYADIIYSVQEGNNESSYRLALKL